MEEALKKMEVEGILIFEKLDEVAQEHHKQGKLDEAVMAYKKAFERAPSTPSDNFCNLYIGMVSLDSNVLFLIHLPLKEWSIRCLLTNIK